MVDDDSLLGSWFMVVAELQWVSNWFSETIIVFRLLSCFYYLRSSSIGNIDNSMVVPSFSLETNDSFIHLIVWAMRVLCCKFVNMRKLWLYVFLLYYSEC